MGCGGCGRGGEGRGAIGFSATSNRGGSLGIVRSAIAPEKTVNARATTSTCDRRRAVKNRLRAASTPGLGWGKGRTSG